MSYRPTPPLQAQTRKCEVHRKTMYVLWWCHIALQHHWKKRCPNTNPMTSVAHVKFSMVMPYRPTSSLEKVVADYKPWGFSCPCRDTRRCWHVRLRTRRTRTYQNIPERTRTYYNVLQRTTTHYHVLQHTTTYCNALQLSISDSTRPYTRRKTNHDEALHEVTRVRTAQYDVLQQRTTTYYGVLQRTTVYGKVLQGTTTHYNVLQCATTYYYVPQRTTLYYHIPRRTTTYWHVLQRTTT